MIRGFKYRFYPTVAQAALLNRTFGACRYVYNWGLDLRTKAFYERGERVNYNKSSELLTSLKRQSDNIWMLAIAAIPMQQSLRHLQAAFVAFFEKKCRYPKFHKKGMNDSAEYVGNAFRLNGNTLSIAKVGKIKIKWSRRFTGTPTTVTLSRSPAGRYYVSFRVDEPLQPIPEATNASIGIDFGLSSFITTSSGSKFQSPKPLSKRLKQLARAQRTLARRQKGSKNREKARIKVAKIHEKIADTRKDFIHKCTTRLIRENQVIFIEDLDVRGMTGNRYIARSVMDAGIGMAIQFLTYKGNWYGRILQKVDRFYPSSKRCSACGYVRSKLELSERIWTCEKCHTKHDRDINAAKNILAEGHSVLACGDGVRPPRSQERKRRQSVKQECL